MITPKSCALFDHDSVGQQQVQGSSVISGLCTTGCWLSSFMHLWSIGTSSGDWLVFGFMYASGSWLRLLAVVSWFSAPWLSPLRWLLITQASSYSSLRAARVGEKKLQGFWGLDSEIVSCHLCHIFCKVKAMARSKPDSMGEEINYLLLEGIAESCCTGADTWVGVIHWDHTLLPAQSCFTNACRINQMDGWVGGQTRMVERQYGLATRTRIRNLSFAAGLLLIFGKIFHHSYIHGSSPIK